LARSDPYAQAELPSLAAAVDSANSYLLLQWPKQAHIFDTHHTAAKTPSREPQQQLLLTAPPSAPAPHLGCRAPGCVACRYDEIVKGLTPFLKQCGYNPKKDLTFIPISALSGHNVKNRAPTEVRIDFNLTIPS
jgi:hypothetical protein